MIVVVFGFFIGLGILSGILSFIRACPLPVFIIDVLAGRGRAIRCIFWGWVYVLFPARAAWQSSVSFTHWQFAAQPQKDAATIPHALATAQVL